MSVVAWKPDAMAFAASTGHHTSIRIWCASNGKVLVTFDTQHDEEVTSLAWGGLLASGSLDTTIKLWDTISWECVCLFRGHAKLISALAWAPGDTHIASGSDDCDLRIWDVHNFDDDPFAVSRPDKWPIRQVAWSNFTGDSLTNHLAVASNKGKIRVYTFEAWPPENMPEPREFTQEAYSSIHALSFSPNGQCLISGSLAPECSIKIWDVLNGEKPLMILSKRETGHDNGVASLTWSPDSKRFASAGSRRAQDKSVKVWDVRSGQCLDSWEDSADVVFLAWAPVHGCCLVSGNWQGNIKIWPVSASDMALSSTEDLDKHDVQDRMAVLLSQWVHEVVVNRDLKLPCLEIKGQRTMAWRECLLFPDLRAGVASGIASVTVTFPKVDDIPAHRAMYIVFKGSSQLSDWLVNVNIQFNRLAYADHGVAPHSTFHQELENRKSLHTSDLRALLERLAGEDEDMDFVITGHSQGGAHAQALYGMLRILEAPADFELNPDAKNMLERARLVTFGAPQLFSRLYGLGEGSLPRPISATFMEAMETARNYVFADDPVPRCFADLEVRQFLRSLAQEMEAKGSSMVRMLSWIPGTSDKLNSIRGYLDRLTDDQSEESTLVAYEESARNYRHFSTIYHINALGRYPSDSRGHWRQFSKNLDCFTDHSLVSYVAAMCLLSKPEAFCIYVQEQDE